MEPTNIKRVVREFKLSSFALKNKTSVFVLIFILLIAGLQSYQSVPKESFPEISLPTIIIGTPYPGNSPVDMENLVTRPMEKEIKGITGIRKLTSSSIQDYSSIVVEFDFDVDPAEALTDVKDAVDRAKPELPNDLPADPNVFEIDFSEFPVMNVNLFGNIGNEALKEHAEYLQDEMEKLPEISGVDIRGLLDKEVKINVDLFKMQSLEINFDDIANAVAAENISMSGGDILSIEGDNMDRRSIRIAGEFVSWEQINGVIVKAEDQKTVYLRDIAEVSFGSIEPISFARMDGQSVVMLDVKKKSGENLLIAADGIKKILEKAKAERLPKDLSIVITNDQSKFTRAIVSNLENSIISGMILVVLVLLFFLGLRNASFVGIAIPLSMLMGIAVISYTGNTLNMMTLFSLILALGMLVDNGIVVVENIYRLKSLGYDNETASREGVGEVAMPIISSTATTLVAFLPLVFWKDLMGEFMKFLPITLIIVLSSSLFVGLVVNPVLTARLMKLDTPGRDGSRKKFWLTFAGMMIPGILLISQESVRALGTILVLFGLLGIIHRYILKPFAEFFQARILIWFEKLYAKTLKFSLSGRKPIIFFLGAIGMLVFSLAFFMSRSPKITFFPDNEPNYVNVFIEMPLGTDIERTNEITKKLEQKIIATIAPYKGVVEAVLAQVGEGTADPNQGFSLGSSPHKARITISFYEYEKRIEVMDVSTSKIMEEIRASVDNVPEAKSISVEKDNMGPPTGKPINIEVSGEDFTQLIILTEEIKKYLENEDIPGVDQLNTDLETGKPELLININRDAARRYGVSTYTISSALRTALFGREVSKFKEGEEDYPIQLRLQDDQRYSLSALMNMKITFRDQTTGKIVQVPVSAVADVETSTTYGSVNRKGMDRVIAIYSNVKEGYNANEIVAKYKDLLADYNIPAGYTVKFTGEQEEQAKSMAFLQQAMMIAMFLIFLIIVSQFNSVIGPVIIMFSVLFSTIGVFLGFAIFGMDMSILMVGIGIISLAGVVVNNAIVLIDYINLLRKRKRAELGLGDNGILPYNEIVNSIVQGGETRFRPVILTAITTVLGLVPLAIGLNIDFLGFFQDFNPNVYTGGDSAIFWGAMAWTIIFGLTFATFLTLVIVPVMYLMADRITFKVKKLFGVAE